MKTSFEHTPQVKPELILDLFNKTYGQNGYTLEYFVEEIRKGVVLVWDTEVDEEANEAYVSYVRFVRKLAATDTSALGALMIEKGISNYIFLKDLTVCTPNLDHRVDCMFRFVKECISTAAFRAIMQPIMVLIDPIDQHIEMAIFQHFGFEELDLDEPAMPDHRYFYLDGEKAARIAASAM